MNLAPDTNAYTDLMRDEGHVVGLVALAEEVAIPFVVLAELRAAFAVGSKGPENERRLELFLGKPQVVVLYPDEGTIIHYAEIYRDLRTRGKMVPQNDLWVAAIVVQYGLSLRTRDAHFDHLPQITRV